MSYLKDQINIIAMVPATCNVALTSKFCASTPAITSQHMHHECSVAIVLPMLVVV